MGLSRTCKKCRCCPNCATCDHKRMESLGYLYPVDPVSSVKIHGNIGTGVDISRISEEIAKALGTVVLHGR